MRQLYWSPTEAKEKTIDFEAGLRVDHIGIHAAPGATFSINGNGEFVIGGTGIFEINLENKGSYIYSIKCINPNNHFVLIDYSGKGVTL
jgi:hypothetical protein